MFLTAPCKDIKASSLAASLFPYPSKKRKLIRFQSLQINRLSLFGQIDAVFNFAAISVNPNAFPAVLLQETQCNEFRKQWNNTGFPP